MWYEVVYVVCGVLMFTGLTTGITCHSYGTQTGPFLTICNTLSIMSLTFYMVKKVTSILLSDIMMMEFW